MLRMAVSMACISWRWRRAYPTGMRGGAVSAVRRPLGGDGQGQGRDGRQGDGQVFPGGGLKRAGQGNQGLFPDVPGGGLAAGLQGGRRGSGGQRRAARNTAAEAATAAKAVRIDPVMRRGMSRSPCMR